MFARARVFVPERARLCLHCVVVCLSVRALVRACVYVSVCAFAFVLVVRLRACARTEAPTGVQTHTSHTPKHTNMRPHTSRPERRRTLNQITRPGLVGSSFGAASILIRSASTQLSALMCFAWKWTGTAF